MYDILKKLLDFSIRQIANAAFMCMMQAFHAVEMERTPLNVIAHLLIRFAKRNALIYQFVYRFHTKQVFVFFVF